MPAKPKPARKPRVIKTAQQRAVETLAARQRQYDKANGAYLDAMDVLDWASADLQTAQARLAHAKANPDLRDDPTLPLEPSHVEGHKEPTT